MTRRSRLFDDIRALDALFGRAGVHGRAAAFGDSYEHEPAISDPHASHTLSSPVALSVEDEVIRTDAAIIEDEPFAVAGSGAWRDMGECTGCGAMGRWGALHRTNLLDPFGSFCGEYR